MKLAISGLTGPVLQFANAVQRAFDGQRSVQLQIVANKAALPNAEAWDGRQIIVRNIDGAGLKGIATAIDGAWFDYKGVVL